MKIAVCPGSFDPVTKGHLDIIQRASKLFDRVIVVVMSNASKSPLFNQVERMELLQRAISEAGIDNVVVDCYDGLLADYVKMSNATAIVKGLRAVSDFEYEFQQAQMNKKLNNELETIFINTRVENLYLSSSAVKQICELGGDISDFVPEIICEDIVERIKRGVSK